MKKFLLLLLISASPLAAAPPDNFDARVEALRKSQGVPGMAIAIVENGKTTLARGFGVRKLSAPEQVDGDTIFLTGSTGKAVTAVALATLVDAGKLGWDNKVIDHIPGFQMYDPWVTREMTVRDLLVHRSGLGLGAGDLLFVPRSNLSRAETVKRLRYIKPATSFRSGYAYDNILYMVAGQLVEEVSGKRWEDYVRDRVFRPLGMNRSTADNDARFQTPNRAFPHARLNGGLRGLGDQILLDERDELGRNAAPAGGLAVSANDMAKWLQVQLGRGEIPGSPRLFSETAAAEMWTPHTIEPISPAPAGLEGTQPNFQTYALGWEVRDYAGAKIIWHAGGVFGFVTTVVLIPERNVAFAVMLNSEDSHVRLGLMYELIDHYLDRPSQDWPARFAQVRQKRLADALIAIQKQAAAPVRSASSLPLVQYAGVYKDPWYGRIEIAADTKGLTIDFKSTPKMAGRLQHWQFDSFITQFADKAIEPAFVTFTLDADGKIERVRMKPVSPIADFSWDYQDLDFTPERRERK